MEQLPAFYLVHQEKVVATGPRVEGYQITAEPPRLNLQGISTQ
jgi:peptide/nickel transport system substrate-binding protein